MPDWILTLAYWLHMLATVVWIGGLMFQASVPVLSPAPRLPESKLTAWLERRWEQSLPLIWLSLAMLMVSGLFQMVASPHYKGLFSLENHWSYAIFIKHGLIVAMAIITAYQSWFIQPELVRRSLTRARGRDGSQQQESALLTRRSILSRINLVLGILVLALTAIARTAR